MPYQYGYPQDYAAHPGYGQMPPQTYMNPGSQTFYQTSSQQSMVNPHLPRHDVPNFQTSPPPYHPPQQPGYYQEPPTQYSQPSQQQYYYPHSHQNFYSQPAPQQSVRYQNQAGHQQLYQNSIPHASPQQQMRYNSQPSPPVQSHYQQRQPSQPAPLPLSAYLSSPHLTQASHPVSQPTSQSYATAQQSRRQSSTQHTSVDLQYQQTSQRIAESSVPQQLSQRVVSHVEIPVQRNASHDMRPSPKRRRSNEGRAVPVCEKPIPQKPTPQQSMNHGPVSSSPLTELPSSQFPPTPPYTEDCQAILLTLADQYTSNAYAMSSSLTTSTWSEDKYEEYDRLLATAMGCLQSVLNNYRQTDPRKEARIRLRLASLLVEETENDEEAEEVLGKGIALCERSRLSDPKYAMHHMLIRVVFKRSPKAAFKAIEKLLTELESLKLKHWIYTFRFLRICLTLQTRSNSDTAAMLKHLAAINALAEDGRHVAVQIVSAALEGIVYLRSGTPDAVDQAQRAIAIARMHQLGPEMKQMPQFKTLLDCIDLACSLVSFDSDKAASKTQQMQGGMDSELREASTNKDGSIAIQLLPTANESLDLETCGIMKRDREGQAALVMRWFTKSQVYALGYLLSGIANMHKNSTDYKAEQYLEAGLKLTSMAPDAVSQSLASATACTSRQTSLSTDLRLYKIFAICTRYDWPTARREIKAMRKDFIKRDQDLDANTSRTLLYLEALCRHGSGQLRSALELYDSPELIFEPDVKVPPAEKDMRALATLNSILILRSLGVEDFVKAENVMNAVEPYCVKHSDQSLISVFYIVKATAQESNSNIVRTKQYLQAAIQAAKVAVNQQLLTIIMNNMTTTFFTGIVGDQAEKSAKTGRTLAKKSSDHLWTSVADGLYGDIMERCGKPAEAEAARREAESLAMELPEALRDTLMVDRI